jgi:hypothetical protein
VLLGTVFGRGWIPWLRSYLKPSVVLVSLGLVTFLTWSAVLRRPDGDLHLAVLDIKDGSALWVRTPGGGRILIGGGESANQLSSALGREAGPFVRRLDALILPSNYADRLGGLPDALARMPAGQIYWLAPPGEIQAAARLEAEIERQGVSAAQLEARQALQLDARLTLTVLAVGERSAAYLIEYGLFCALAPGGFSPVELDGAGRGCLLLLGERDDIEEWARVEALGFSVSGECPVSGVENCYATEQNGRIEVRTDGERMWVRAERK